MCAFVTVDLCNVNYRDKAPAVSAFPWFCALCPLTALPSEDGNGRVTSYLPFNLRHLTAQMSTFRGQACDVCCAVCFGDSLDRTFICTFSDL